MSNADAPSSGSTPSHHLAAVWFADLVGYTTLSETNEGEALRAVNRFQAIARAVVQTHGGRVVKFLGDGALAEFASTEQAVRSADALRADFTRVAEAQGLGVKELRIGVHVGDVAATADGDLYGDGVNVASRIQATADPGEVWVSEDVRRQLRQRPELRFASRGAHTLKGLQMPIELHAVGIGENAPRDLSPAPSSPDRTARDTAASRPKPARSRSRSRAVSLLGVGAMIAIVAIGASTWLGRGPDTDEANPVLAVLPFENLSRNDETEPFVLGMHDDLLSQLSRLGALKVISRTSVMGYQGTEKSVPEIARELGATAVLEGAVQRSGDRIRVNVQLIDARTDEHLWAEQYDRTLTAADVFAIQAEIAERIAGSLTAAMTAQEKADLAAAPTQSLTALDAYYRGLAYYRDRFVPGYTERAESSFAAAVEADPEFAVAWAALAKTRAWKIALGLPQQPEGVREALDRSAALAPDSRDTALAYAIYLYYALGDLQGAAERYHQILSRWSLDAEALGQYAWVLRRLGRWKEALEMTLRAQELDPRNQEVVYANGVQLTWLRRYDEAERILQEAIALNPDYLAPRAGLLTISFLRGDTARARRQNVDLIGRFPPQTPWPAYPTQLALQTREYEAGIAALRNLPDDPANPGGRTLVIAILYRLAGQRAEARTYADSALVELERWIEEKPSESPDAFALKAVYIATRGEALAVLGRSAEAVRSAQQATAMVPVERNPLGAEGVLHTAAWIYILVGDHDAAFRALDELASIPSTLLSAATLRLEPIFDPLRGDPRYVVLLRKLEAAERSGTGTR